MALSEKELLFGQEYIICKGNAYQAARNAGYSEQTALNASRWLDEASTKKYKPELVAYINEQMEKIHTQKSADAKEVIEYLTAVMRGEHTEQTLRGIGEGAQVIDDIDVSAKDRLKAATELAKILGLNNKVDLNGTVGVVIVDDIENS